MSNSQYTITKLRLSSAAESLAISYWTGGKYHVSQARTSLVDALSGAAHHEDGRECLIDIISNAITDSVDVDWTADSAAILVLDAILDACIPTPEGSEGECHD